MRRQTETLVTTWTRHSCPYRSHWSRSRGQRPQTPRPTAWEGVGRWWELQRAQGQDCPGWVQLHLGQGGRGCRLSLPLPQPLQLSLPLSPRLPVPAPGLPNNLGQGAPSPNLRGFHQGPLQPVDPPPPLPRPMGRGAPALGLVPGHGPWHPSRQGALWGVLSGPLHPRLPLSPGPLPVRTSAQLPCLPRPRGPL